MSQDDKIKSVVFEAIDEINQQLLEQQRLSKSPEVVLVGGEAMLDSMAFVNLIVAVEEKMVNEFGVNITLVDERAFSQDETPFKTIGNLIDYISNLLKEQNYV